MPGRIIAERVIQVRPFLHLAVVGFIIFARCIDGAHWTFLRYVKHVPLFLHLLVAHFFLYIQFLTILNILVRLNLLRCNLIGNYLVWTPLVLNQPALLRLIFSLLCRVEQLGLVCLLSIVLLLVEFFSGLLRIHYGFVGLSV